MTKRFWAFALILCLSLLGPAAAAADTLGPAASYPELLALAESASDGDVLLVAGSLLAGDDAPLGTRAAVRIRSSEGGRAVIRSLRLVDANVGFDEIDLEDTLSIEGECDVHLSSSVSVRGADGREGILFAGNGALLIDSGAEVSGGSGGAGISVRHESGDFYIDIEGSVRGGGGEAGGPGVEITRLSDGSALMVAGDIRGGDGERLGGQALNLYDLSGNAYVTLDGSLSGGSGHVGGNGVQIVSATDSAIVGVSGSVTGGLGEAFGGDALMLMNVEGASTVSLSGALRGGDVTAPDAHPGTSLLVVGDTTSARTRVEGCLLEDGRRLALSGRAAETSAPEVSQAPEQTPAPEPTPAPTAEPTAEPASTAAPAQPEATAAPEPTAEPEQTAAPEPTAEPETTAEPEATPAPDAEPAQPATPEEPAPASVAEEAAEGATP